MQSKLKGFSNQKGCLFQQRRQLRSSPSCKQIRVFAQKLDVFSPSKVNLFLRVVRRREDGYHDLASLFHVIDLGDDMSFEAIDGELDQFSCDVADLPVDDSNLVIRALNLFRSKTGIQQHFKVDLRKKVPQGAGLGGGSGNAATTLWAANQLTGGKATDQQLLDWSADIGSDISVFFSKGAAYCTGRGEIVKDVPPPLPLDTPILLIKPPLGLSTGQIFKNLDLDGRSKADPLELLKGFQKEGVKQEFCVNDLEAPAFYCLPKLAELKQQLQKEGDFQAVFMTGSGSTVVGLGSQNGIPPTFLESLDDDYFVSNAKFMVRQNDQWYQKQQLQ